MFFKTMHQYTVNDSVENVKVNIESAIQRKWHDFAGNMQGRFINDDTFIVTPKWSLVVIKWVESDLTYLKGTISYEGNKTLINTTIRPNSGLVISFYAIVGWAFFELFGITDVMKNGSRSDFLIFPLLTILLSTTMVFSVKRMKGRFERLVDLNAHCQ